LRVIVPQTKLLPACPFHVGRPPHLAVSLRFQDLWWGRHFGRRFIRFVGVEMWPIAGRGRDFDRALLGPWTKITDYFLGIGLGNCSPPESMHSRSSKAGNRQGANLFSVGRAIFGDRHVLQGKLVATMDDCIGSIRQRLRQFPHRATRYPFRSVQISACRSRAVTSSTNVESRGKTRTENGTGAASHYRE